MTYMNLEERIYVTINGNRYPTTVENALRECHYMYGAVTPATLAKYGVPEEYTHVMADPELVTKSGARCEGWLRGEIPMTQEAYEKAMDRIYPERRFRPGRLSR